jgi:hypothetical protein
MDYYKYSLMDPASQETAKFLDAAAVRRPVGGANTGEEETIYRRALAQAIKQTDHTVIRSVVVAHCNEDLSWMEQLDPALGKFVYSKGNKIALIPKDAIPLDNVGREYHTYFTHIARHYDTISDVTFFLQGWPLDRSAHVISGVNYLRHFDFIEFGTQILETGPVGDQLLQFMGHVFGQDWRGYSREPWAFRANTQFGVSRRRVRLLPKLFYEKCASVCVKGVPEFGISVESVPYLFEQIMQFIFQPYHL